MIFFNKSQRLFFFFGWGFSQVQVFGGSSYWASVHLRSIAEVLLAEQNFIDCNSLAFRAQGDWYLLPSVSVRKHLSGCIHREQCKQSLWIQCMSSVWVLSSKSPKSLGGCTLSSIWFDFGSSLLQLPSTSAFPALVLLEWNRLHQTALDLG